MGALFVLLVTNASEASGQSATQRAALDAFRDSLDAMTVPSQVASMLRWPRPRGSGDARQIYRIREGWILLRLGVLTDSASLVVSGSTQFYEAAVRRSRWPYAWFGLGSAKVILGGMRVREQRSAHQPAGTGWKQGAIAAFSEAVRADPSYRPAAIELAKTSLSDDQTYLLRDMNAIMSAAVASDSTDPLGWFLLARYQRRIGADSAAANSYRRVMQLGASGYSGLATIELARELFWSGQADSGAYWYYYGATEADSAALREYRRDLQALAGDSVLAEWDQLSPQARAGWLQSFWGSRETESGRAHGSRLQEHYRRWKVAYQRYRLLPAWTRAYEFGMPYRSGNDELDDRGVIYVRHGEPDETVWFLGGEKTEPNDTWVYYRPDGNLIFHFKLAQASSGVSGWRAIESLAFVRTDDQEGMIASRVGVDPIYQRLLVSRMAGGSGGGSEWTQERLLVRNSLARGTTTDSDPLRFERRWEPIVQVFGVGRNADTGGRLIVVVGLPVDKEAPSVRFPDGGVGYVLHLRVAALDGTLDVDSMVRLRVPQALRRGQLLAFVREFAISPGSHRVRVVVSDSAGEGGGARVVDGVPVPLHDGTFEISDLVTGLEGGSLYWTSGADRFPLNPRNAWIRSEAMEVGFELSGLPAGAPYKVRISVADLGADSTKPHRASVEFQNQASGERELVTQSLGLRALRPGRYLLAVTVTAGERTIRRERRVTIAAGR